VSAAAPRRAAPVRRLVVAWALLVSGVSVLVVGVPLVVAAGLAADGLDLSLAVMLAVAFGLVAMGGAVALGVLAGRSLVTGVATLEERAEKLGSGHTRSPLRPTGVSEIDRVGELLERSAERVDRLLAAERQFASDASHQLRTPLTALSMRLEEILQADDPATVREEARSALAQVERLATVVEHLLDSVRDSRLRAGPVPLDEVVLQQVVEWEPAFHAAGRAVRASGTRGLIALATPNGLSQVLATLIENSLVHGAGTVTVSTRSTGISLVVEVTDEGPGVPAELGARIFERSVSGRRGTGLGLAVARELAEADGGRLELVQQAPAVFALFLSAAGGPR
jgi:signal transduction histidine kinase